MVEIDPSKIKELQNQIDDLKGSFSSAGDKFTNYVTGILSGIDSMTSKWADAKVKSSDFLDNITKSLNDNKEGIIDVTIALGAMTGALDKVFPMSKAFDSINSKAGNAANTITDQFGRSSQALMKMVPGLEGVGEAFQKNLLTKVDQMKNLENSLLKTEAQTGDLGDTFHRFGPDLAGIDRYLDGFGKRLESIGNATGRSTSEIAGFAMNMKTIPGLFNEMTKATDASGNQMDILTAAIKVSNGSIRDLDKVFDIVNKQVTTFGGTGEQALQVISRMHSAVQQTGIPFNAMQSYVESTAEKFKFFGNQSQSALSIVSKFAPALRDSGLGPAAISEIVGDMTAGIQQMDIAQKSFVAAQSKVGPGGLAGGYKIDLMLQEGKTDQVLNLVMDTLKNQFGGAIVTLKDAAQDQAAAAQLTKQVAFLRQGPLGSYVKSDAEAYKLLEAMKAGTGGAALKSPEEAMKGALSEGEGIQKRQTTILTQIANSNERAAQVAAQQLYLMARQTLGAQSGSDAIKSLIFDSQKYAVSEAGRLASGAGGTRMNMFGDVTRGAREEAGNYTPTQAIIAESNRIVESTNKAANLIKDGVSDMVARYRSSKDIDMNKSMEDMRRKQELMTMPPDDINADTLKITQAAEANAIADAKAGSATGQGKATDHVININTVSLDGVKNIATIEVQKALDVKTRTSRNHDVGTPAP